MTWTTHTSSRDTGGSRMAAFGRGLELLAPRMEEIRDLRPILPPLAVGWILTALATYATLPLVEVVLTSDSPGAPSYLRSWLWTFTILAPVLQMGRALMWTATAWALLTLASREAGGRELLSIFLYAESVVAAYGVALALYLQLTVDPASATAADLLDPLSLWSMVPSSHGLGVAWLKNVDAAHAIWIGFVALAGRRVLGLTRRAAVTLAGVLWVGSVLVAVGRVLTTGGGA
ncbi:MAG: hypothetical protein P8188_04215 [Gemmatimonadota bacterium]